MTVKQIYDLAIKEGIRADFRGQKDIQEMLRRLKSRYSKMSVRQKQEFDQERLVNPFSDTRILNDNGKQIKKILTGIDMDVAELMLADKLGDIDLVLAHHPQGKALACLDDVMRLQADVMSQYGVPINIAEALITERLEEVGRGISAVNHNRAVDMAKMLHINYMCVHTPCDNLVANFLDKLIAKNKPTYVEDLIDLLKEVPEYKQAIQIGAGPKLFSGKMGNRTGKIGLLEITGGTESSPKVYTKLAQAGVGTVVGMHIGEEHRKEAYKAHINVVIAGHIASDSIGMNLFLDQLEQKGIEIIPVSGLIRVKRFKLKK
ncbi:MAG: NGG1p interacting factor NIF3 [Patescibacteria group bacterium]|jgi:hypothetical protein|nr:NGG1p interacting factor NIF3 [Patescibacteria group bacterium]